MEGAHTEVGPMAAEAGTRMGAAPMEAADRTVRAAAADILVRAGRVGAARISVVGVRAAADSAAAVRRDIRRRGRVAARTEARRPASRAAIRGLTAGEAMGGRAEVTAAPTVARVQVDPPTTATAPPVDTARVAMVDRLTAETWAAPVARHIAETTERMAAHDKADRTEAATLTGILATLAALTVRPRIAAIPT
jgi:hypothetical protein